MNNVKTFKNTASLFSVFLLGNIIISFPKGEGQTSSFLGFVLSVILGAAFCVAYSYLQSKSSFGISLFSDNKLPSVLKACFISLIVFIAVLSYLICTKDYIALVSSIRLPNTNVFIIAAVFIGMTLLIALSDKRVLSAFALVSVIVIFIAEIIMFILSIENMNLNFLSAIGNFQAKSTFKQMLTFFIHSFGQIGIPILLIGFMAKENSYKNNFKGLALGSILFFICFINTLLLTGITVINKTDFPYSTATAMITWGKNYARLDGFTYYIFFICSLIKAAVLLKSIYAFFETCIKKYKKTAAVICAAVGLLFSAFGALGEMLQSKTANLLLLIAELILPVIIFTAIKITDTARQ